MLRHIKPETAVLSGLIAAVASGAIWMYIIADSWDQLSRGAWWIILLLILSFIVTILSVFVIYAHEPRVESNSELKSFKVSIVNDLISFRTRR